MERREICVLGVPLDRHKRYRDAIAGGWGFVVRER